jgi:catechol-2,3-dioxygenase
VFLVAYFVLQLRFRLSEEGNHQTHALEVFNRTSHKVVKVTISYTRIQANNTYYKDVLGLKMNKKLGSSSIYLTKEQYS